MKCAVSAMNTAVELETETQHPGLRAVQFPVSCNPSFERLHQKGQLRIDNNMPFWQLQLQSKASSCGCEGRGQCASRRKAPSSCCTVYARALEDRKWEIGRKCFFYSQNCTTGEIAAGTAKQTWKIWKPALWLVFISSTNTVSSQFSPEIEPSLISACVKAGCKYL